MDKKIQDPSFVRGSTRQPSFQTQQKLAAVTSAINKAAPFADAFLKGRTPAIRPTVSVSVGKAPAQQQSVIEETSPTARPTKQVKARVSALILLVVGIAMGVGGFFLLKQSAMPSGYNITDGKVSTTETALDTTGGSYYPVYEFVVDNKVYFYKSNIGQKSQPITGDKIRVAYNPSNPGEGARNASEKTTKLMSFVLLGVGPLLVIFSGVSFLKKKPQ